MHSVSSIKITCSKSASCIPVKILLELKKIANIEWGQSLALEIISSEAASISFTSVYSICRYIARTAAPELYGKTILENTEVDHWLDFCSRKYSVSDFKESLLKIDSSLATVTYLVGDSLTLADICVWSTLYSNKQFYSIHKNSSHLNLKRWYSFISSKPEFQAVEKDFPVDMFFNPSDTVQQNSKEKVKMEDKGKFVDLPGAEIGKVIVRFPPEASGYLHIGHAKAALLNAHYQTSFQGKLIMRFDDTNPEKEKEDFEKVILEDVSMLQIKPDIFTYTSDHFEIILQKCEQLLRSGHAYIDDTDPETMKSEREQKQESKNRNNDLAKNCKMWGEMKIGTDYGKKCCVRAKIDMNSDNGCLRDPTLYRCKTVPHPRTGNKYNVYPTYDFACPIVDSIENVTHALRTTEYHDRDEQYFWVLDALKMRKPHIYEYSRLNMTHTVLSKRKLTWFVNEGIVESWEDPRMPTVRGVLRRGMTVEGLTQFIVAQGSSRSVVVMEWDKIWAFNKKVIDPISPRYNAVEKDNCVPVDVEGAATEIIKVALHPKNPELGMKDIQVGPKLLVDRFDAEAMKVGENVTFINWGNLLITCINRDKEGQITCVKAKANIDNKDYKKTLKVTWVTGHSDISVTPCLCVYYDHLISKAILGKDEDFKSFLNNKTKVVVPMVGDIDLANLKKGAIIQIQRKGFFICDEPYDPETLKHTSRAGPVVLFYIPDGSKDTSVLPEDVKKVWIREESAKERIMGLKGKDFEMSPQIEEKSFCGGDSAADPGFLDVSSDLDLKIRDQGNLVRKLKSEKCDKSVIDKNVKLLLNLKAEFKSSVGKDWTPDNKTVSSSLKKEISTFKATSKQNNVNDELNISVKDMSTAVDLQKKIKNQGDKVRKLKSDKSDKGTIDSSIQELLKLKTEFKTCTGIDWKPDLNLTVDDTSSKNSGVVNEGFHESVHTLNDQIKVQGDTVRKLKSQKAEKSAIDSGVQQLLKLKEKFKTVAGMDWKPDLKLSTTGNAEEKSDSLSDEDFCQKIKLQGDLIRKLKAEKSDKGIIDSNVKDLLKLKDDYKKTFGKEWKPDNPPKSQVSNPKKESASDKKKEKVEKPASNPKENQDSGIKKVTRLGLETRKEENLADWYSQVLTKGEMIEYYDVSGCYILRPWAYCIWESIQKFFDSKIKELGVSNAYFPMFVSSSALEKEKSHIEDFAPEVAWVTKSGSSDLEKPIAIRPTSETVMYPSYAKWIRSHRDLPLKLNQWCNVVRWEFKNPQPFIRTREFLWQEGHTAFANKEEAEKEVLDILGFYTQVYVNLLAIPVICGRKTEKEKFAGGEFTTTTELYIPASGRGLQGATSHHLGQNFSKMFEIMYEDPETNEKQYVYQNSWGLTTRTIGAMVMIHADNTGLVLPPRIAAYQVVIVPCGITASMKESEKDTLLAKCLEFESVLKGGGITVKGDYRDNYSPGWKFNHWELKGVPIRIELGPKDLKKNQFVAVRRDTGEKLTISIDTAPNSVLELLDSIQNNLYNSAKAAMDSHLCISYDWTDFCKKLDEKFIIQAPFCCEIECEDNIKKDSAKSAEDILEPGAPAMGAKSLCIPFEQPAKLLPNTKCIYPSCTSKPTNFTLFGRSY